MAHNEAEALLWAWVVVPVVPVVLAVAHRPRCEEAQRGDENV